MSNTLELARRGLPSFVVWGNLLYLLLALVASVALAYVSLRVAIGRPMPASSPWPERARQAFPARAFARMASIALPVGFTVGAIGKAGPFSYVSSGWLCCLTFALTFACVRFVARAMNRSLGVPNLPFAASARGFVSMLVVLMPHFVLAVAIAVFDPPLIAKVVLAALVVCGAMGGGVYLARALALVEPASERTLAAVRRASERAGIAARAVYELPWQMANAFAFPLIRSLGFTRSALDVLSDDELEGVTLHELGHLSEPLGMRVSRVLVGLALAFAIASGPALYRVNPWAPIVLGVLVIAVVFGMRKLGRRMEERADAHAVAHDSAVYARALEKLYEKNLVPVVMGRGTLHPHLYDRLIAAGAPPSYPRPKPPSKVRAWLAFGIVLGGVLIQVVTELPIPGDSGALWRIASGRENEGLSDLALARFNRGDLSGSAALYRASASLHQDSYGPANLALVEIRLGHCDAARKAAAEAERRVCDDVSARETALIRAARTAADECRNNTERHSSADTPRSSSESLDE